MTLPSSAPVLLDDPALIRAVVTPRARLFPTLNRASAFAPLIVVCCVLPAFQLLAEPTLNEEASLWGLRSIALSNATTVADVVEPGLNEQGEPLVFQPPLASWLNGLMVWMFGPSHLMSSSLVSLAATGIAIWVATRLAWRIGGANTSLIAALLMCCHPQVLECAIGPSYCAVGLCLSLVSAFGFQRHLEGKSANFSANLMISSIAWGLMLLDVGPIAFGLPVLFAIHGWNQRSVSPAAGAGQPSASRIREGGWPVLRSTLTVTGIGLLIGGWWEILMGIKYGSAFWSLWWTNLPAACMTQGTSEWRCDLRPILQPDWQEWMIQQALLIGWLVVGLERSWHEWRRPSSEMARRRYQFLLLWWSITFAGRILAEIAGTRWIVNTSIWNLALLPPTILMSAVGIGTLIERRVTRRGEFSLMVLLVCLVTVRLTMSWSTGLTAGALVALFLMCGPMLIPSWGRAEKGWSEKGWRQLLQITVYASLLACLSSGLGDRCRATTDQDRLAELRRRLVTFPDVRRISLLVTRDPVPVTLRYLLRCRFPKAELATSEGWDTGLTREMTDESSDPHSRFLILEWTRRDVRLSADTGQRWQISTVGDPMRFLERRLSLILIEPRT